MATEGSPQAPKPVSGSGEYGMAEEKPQAASRGPAGASWYVVGANQQKEGPLPLEVVKMRYASGQLKPGDLVWRQGMPDWKPAGEVPELGGAGRPSATPGPGPIPSPGPGPIPVAAAVPASRPSADSPSDPSMFLPPAVEQLLASPMFFRIVGRVCAVLAVLWLFFDLVRLTVGYHASFVMPVLFVLLFLVGEAAAAILQRLDRRD